MSDLSLEGHGVLVTGASRGIGATIAETLAAHGARVAVHYGRGKAEAEEVAQKILAAGGPEPVVLGARLEHEDERRKLHRDVVSALGDPLLLVNNAALWDRNPFDEPDDALFLSRWRHTLEVNLNAAAHLALLALPAMRKARFGRIVMVSSRAAFRGETECADYAVSKAGMVSLARCLARAEGPNGITANSVCPGWVETDRVAAHLEEHGDAVRAEIPLGRVATTQDVANAVLFYLSPLGSYANGTALPLNGASFLH